MLTDSPYLLVAQIVGMIVVVRLLSWLRPWRLVSQWLRGHRG